MPDRPHDKQRDIILDSIADGVFTVDAEWRITSFNRAAEHITGVDRAEAAGKRCCDVFRASICETDCALRRTMETGRPVVNKAVYIVNADGERVPISISTALLKDDHDRVIGGVETFRDLSLVAELRKELDGRHAFEDIISRNHRMHQLFDILPEIARSDTTVLIHGESGTGKELVARAIHNLSPRRRKRLVTVNCGALPDTLLESELFGHKAGAFTDAKRDRKGRFELAHGGTIFLDEIGDVSPALQVRLLRVLQERTFEPLGATDPVHTDVRVIAATNKNLDRLVADGTFRHDLYYRINVLRLDLPPLRERKEDVPLLVEHTITRLNRLRQKDVAGLAPEVLAVLMEHDYPGNIRELENILEHAFVLCPGGMIEPHHLPERLRPQTASAPAYPTARTLKDIEARFIRDALARHNWNRQATAKALGIHKTTLFRKIKSLNIHLPPKDGRTRPTP